MYPSYFGEGKLIPMTISSETMAQAYVELALAIERHQPGYVDAYFGPPEWRQKVEAAELPPVAALREKAEALAAVVAQDTTLTEPRQDFLNRQLRAMQTSLRLLAGEVLP